MNYRNEIVITGNLGSEPKLIETKKGGVVIAVFSLANNVTRFNEATKQSEKLRTNWIPVKLFGETANNAVKSLKKGDLVTVFGKFSTQDYETKDGKKVKSFEVIAGGIQKEEFAVDLDKKAKEREEKEAEERENNQNVFLEKAFYLAWPSVDSGKILNAYCSGIGPLKDVKNPLGRAYALRKWGIAQGLVQEN